MMLWHSFGKKYLKMQVLGENVASSECDFHTGFSADMNSVVYQTEKHLKKVEIF